MNEKVAAIFIDGEEQHAICQAANGKYYNYYGWNGRIRKDGFLERHSFAGGFDDLGRAEKAMKKHRPKAIKKEKLNFDR